VNIRLTEYSRFGVMDQYVYLARGEECYGPWRVFQNGAGAEVAFTLFRQPGMSIEKFEADAAWVKRDLATLRERFSS